MERNARDVGGKPCQGHSITYARFNGGSNAV